MAVARGGFAGSHSDVGTDGPLQAVVAEQRAAEAFERGVGELADAGCGVGAVLFVDREDVWGILAAVRRGDPQAAAYAGVVSEFLTRLERASRRRAALCLTCERVLFGRKRPLVIAVLLPHCPEPSRSLVGGFCRSCAVGGADWPEPGWRHRLTELLTPRLRELWGPRTCFAELSSLGAAGTA
jgi:hypothetical protein